MLGGIQTLYQKAPRQKWSQKKVKVGGIFFFFNLFYLFGCARSSLQYAGASIFMASCEIFRCGMQDLALQLGMEPRPCPTPTSRHTHTHTHTRTHTHTHTHWKCRVLATGPPGKSLGSVFLTSRNRDEIAEATSKPSRFPRDILFQEVGCC